MTRYQVWKARERARFRLIGVFAQLYRKYAGARGPADLWLVVDDAERDRLHNAQIGYVVYQTSAYKAGIPEPFLG